MLTICGRSRFAIGRSSDQSANRNRSEALRRPLARPASGPIQRVLPAGPRPYRRESGPEGCERVQTVLRSVIAL